MAVAAALFGITKSVLRVLASPALDEFRLLWGQKEQLERLEGTLTTIRSVLHDADRRQTSDASVQGWLTRLKVVLYQADDLFDMISAKLLHDKAKTGYKVMKKVNLFLLKPRHFAFVVKTAHKVKSIRERLDYIARDIQGFGFLPIQIEQDELLERQTHSYVPNDEVIGRERERDDLVKMLLVQQSGVSVVAIIGIGGLGKTTLAQLVYNDDRVCQGFDLCMWACVNYFTQLKQVLVTLIKSATKNERKDLDLDQLQNLFREEIQGKRYLLVLDDVWDEDPQNWHQLKILLDSGKNGSMILATTRSERVAHSMCATMPYCRLKGLSDQSAWILFKKIAFGEEERQNHQGDLEQLGRQIVKKCANVPLAIVTIARLLRNREKKKWLPLINDELSRVAPDEHNKIMQILKISYNKLPYAVKSCFAYCSLFPKHYRFEKDLFVRLWIAQGFVELSNASQSLEDIVEGYFSCLVERCFFQDMKKKGNGVYTWGMHDLVYDLAVEVAQSECVTVFENALNCWDKALRHVSSYSEISKFESVVDHVSSFSHSKSLRTFLFYHFGVDVGKNALNKLMASFKALRVLKLSLLTVNEIPSSIGELIHLRFVDLSGTDIRMLPSSISNLHHLQSLILEGCWNLQKLPKDMENLLSLRHLVLKGCNRLSQMAPGLADLTSLVTLDRLVVDNRIGGLRYLELLDNLNGSLEILLPMSGWTNAKIDAERSFLSRKNKLHTLAIKWESELVEQGLLEEEHFTVMVALQPHHKLEHLSIQNFRGKEMPPWLSCRHNLVSLELLSCKRCAKLPSLSRHPFLKELKISDMPLLSAIEDIMLYNPDLFFRSLKTLSISKMPNLTSWWFQAPVVLPSFPLVTKVFIYNCPKLRRCMPLFPLVLERLMLENVGEELIWHGIRSEVTGLGSHGNSVLNYLEISRIHDLRSMSEAQLIHLSALRTLIIKECAQLESVSSMGLSCLTSLEKLEICQCPVLKWIERDDQKLEVPWGHLLRLRCLVITNMNMNLFKGLKYLTCLEFLDLQNVNPLLQSVSDNEEEEDGMPWKSLEKLRNLILVSGETSEHFLKGVQYLTSLRYLAIYDFKELHLSWKALRSLKDLQHLMFFRIEKLIDVDSTMGELPPLSALSCLEIQYCSAQVVHEIPWKSFPALESLDLLSINNLEALPEGFQHLAALQRLNINSWNILISPCWLSSSDSFLSDLHFSETSDELKKRCKRPNGQDWPHIQHIRRIDIA